METALPGWVIAPGICEPNPWGEVLRPGRPRVRGISTQNLSRGIWTREIVPLLLQTKKRQLGPILASTKTVKDYSWAPEAAGRFPPTGSVAPPSKVAKRM